MESKKIEINLSENQKELIIREGSALKQQEPIKVEITGTIGAPSEYLLKRKTEIDVKKCHVLFSFVGMFIKFIINECDHYRTEIIGKASINSDLEKFGINKNKIFTIKELKQFLKMNRVFFADIDSNMKMVTNLERFSASVQTQIDAHSNDRGDKKTNFEVKVDSNLDLNFVLNMPIFTGEANKKFKVEVCCDIRDGATSIWLESPELQQIIIQDCEALISKNIEPFKEEFVLIQQ